MVLDSLANAARYVSLNPGLDQAFAFLARPDLPSLEAGKHPIDGDRVFAIVTLDPGRGHADATRESHRKYLDVQVTLAGDESIGWKPVAACTQPLGEHDAAKDVRLYSDEPSAWVSVGAGQFAIFFPEDMHAPLGGVGALHKVIVKVAVGSA